MTRRRPCRWLWTAALGGLFTAFSAGVIIAQLGVVRASRCLGQRRTLVASMLLMCAGSLAIAQSGDLLVLFAAALLGGFGFGGVLATGNTLVAQLFGARSAAALNGINLFFGIGSIVGPALAAAANRHLNAPQLALWIGAGVMAALSAVVLGVAASSSGGVTSIDGSTRGAAPARSWLFGILLLVYTGTEIGLGAWLALYMISSAALDAAGLLQGYRAATHWLAMDLLPILGAEPVHERVVIDRNRITGGGITAGIDCFRDRLLQRQRPPGRPGRRKGIVAELGARHARS